MSTQERELFTVSRTAHNTPLSSFSITKVFRRPFNSALLQSYYVAEMYCEPVLVTVNDSCSCVDVKSGLLCLTLDLNPCDKKRKPQSI